jgi:two-component system, NarL family, sensor histidine kinase UhpB
VGLRERAHLVSGRIDVDTAPGRGTVIEVSIPLPQAS